MTDDVSLALKDLASAAPTYRADLPALTRAAGRRRLRRRLERVAAGVLAVAVVATAGALLAQDRTDRLVVPGVPGCSDPVTAAERAAVDRVADALGASPRAQDVLATCLAPQELAGRELVRRVLVSLGSVRGEVQLERFEARPAPTAAEVAALVADRVLAARPGLPPDEQDRVSGRPLVERAFSRGSRAQLFEAPLGLTAAVWSPGGVSAVVDLRPGRDLEADPVADLLALVAALVDEVLVEQPDPSPSPGLRTVDVFLSSGGGACDEVVAVRRDVRREAPLRPALEALFAGATPEETASGIGVATAPGLLRSVRVDRDVVYVDLVASLLPGVATTSCGGSIFMSTLTATVRGLVPDARVVVALDGDPEAFVQAQQGFCPEPATRGDRCDASGFS